MIGRSRPIDRPILIVGMGRSGTTLTLEVLAARSDLAWFSRPLNRVPWLPVVCTIERLSGLHPSLQSTMYRSDQVGPGLRRLRRLERLRLGPTEGTKVWNHWLGTRFTGDYMLGVDASESERLRMRELVSKVLKYEGRKRFIAKITGPGRLHFLSSLFPDALFVHVIRDGRAVVHSLMNFPPWRDTHRSRRPAWRNGLGERDLERWRQSGESPVALAAIQWRAVIEATRRESAELSPSRYSEIRYEDLLADPHRRLDEITAFCQLPRSAQAHAVLERRALRDMNYQWREGMPADEAALIEALAGDLLEDLGYITPEAPG